MYNKDKVYVILRRVPLHNIVNRKGTINSDAFNAWKELTGADHVLKTATHFLYCETVTDAEWEDAPMGEYIEKGQSESSG